MSTDTNNGIQIGGNLGNNVGIVNHSSGVNINITNQMQESQSLLDHEFEKLVRDAQLTQEQVDKLRASLDDFKAYVESQEPRKSIAETLLNNVKSVFSGIIGNSAAIEKIMQLGQKMIDLWK